MAFITSGKRVYLEPIFFILIIKFQQSAAGIYLGSVDVIN